jgi:uncharacterized membrane protein
VKQSNSPGLGFQSEPKPPSTDRGRLLSPHRLESLTDGVYAIAMTILVLELTFPLGTKIETSATFLAVLATMWAKFYCYVLSFLILSMMWIGTNDLLCRLKHTDKRFVMLNITTLMFIVLVPFTTGLMGDYSDIPASNIVFHLNLLVISVLGYLKWRHLEKNGHLVDQTMTAIEELRAGKRGMLPFIVVPIAAIVLTLFITNWSNLLYLSYLIIPYIASRMKRGMTNERGLVNL